MSDAPAPESEKQRRLPSAVIWLGVVSFLTDASGEMIYPLLPRFLTVVLHASTGFVGVIEGIAETTASLLKLVSGRLADAMPRKKPLTVAGYALSSLARPLVALATSPWFVLGVRFTDRVGKGIRSSPRDAMMAEITPSSRRGAAYGYHRAMDNAGAVVGPLVGFALLAGLHVELRTIFACASIPAALAVAALVFGVREPPPPLPPPLPLPLPLPISPSPTAPSTRTALPRYLVAVGAFTLANSSDAFLLLRAADAGISPSLTLILWTAHNATKALLNRRFGALSDRIGRRWLIGGGWLIYAATYLGFGLATAAWQIWALFLLYGFYYALVEGSERALVADLAGPGRRGRAFGWYNSITGLLALPASVGFGWLYKHYSARTAFTVAAALAAGAAVLLATLVERRRATAGAAAAPR